MKKIGVFYFSGTGNTEIVARLLTKAYRRRQIEVACIRMEAVVNQQTPLALDDFDLIGVGHPVLGFGASGLAERFVKMLPAGSGKPAFVFKTASSPHYVNHGASDVIIRSMAKKGYQVFHNSIIAMPCNFFVKYDDRLNKQLYQAAVKKVEVIAAQTAAGQANKLKFNPLLRGFLRLVYYGEEHFGARFFAQGLHATAACNHCKKCVRDCPTRNISESDGQIFFGADCIWCMRCVYACPNQAIQAKNLAGCVLHPYTGGFNIEAILNDPQIDENFVTEKSKGYYKHLINYFGEDSSIK